MSKESNKIVDAYYLGQSDKLASKPRLNPFKKNSQKSKYKAYENGYALK